MSGKSSASGSAASAAAAALVALGLTMPVQSLFAPQANAFELLGFCLVKPCEDDTAGTEFIDPHFYDVDFILDPTMSEEMKNAILAASELWRGRDKPVAGSAGVIARAKSDYRRILASLYNSGRYAGEISIRLNDQEVSDLETSADLPNRSSLAVSVKPGPRYLLGKTSIINQAPETFEEKDQVDSPTEIGFAPGELARADVVQKAADLSVDAWRELGYPKAQLLSKDVIANHPNNQLNVTLHLDSGPKANYGELVVSGADNMDPEFLAYMTGLEPGREYDPDDLKKAYKRLDRLGVLSTRNIKEADAVTRSGTLPLELVVKERALRRFGVGTSLSSTDGAGVEAYWLHRNLFGKAERLRVDANFSGLGATNNIDKYDYSIGATFTKPGVFNPDLDFTSNLYAKHEFNESYEEDGYGASGKFVHYMKDEVTRSVGAFIEVSKFNDLFGKRSFTTTGIEGDIVWDDRDNKLDASTGYYARVNAKPFYEWEFGNPGARLETEARAYRALTSENRTILAARVKLGSAIGEGISQSAPSFLFNAGGGSSVRGFDYKGIGIINAAGQESPGKSLFETSLELRQKLVGNFGMVAFVDAGTVGQNSLIDFDEELSIGLGLGLRYYTGLGPIRLDVAIPMNKTPGDSDFAVYAGLGQAF